MTPDANADLVDRLVRAADASAWARDRLPALVACATPADVLRLLVDEAVGLTGAPEVWAVVFAGDPERPSFRALAGRGRGAVPAEDGDLVAPQALSTSIVGRVVREGRPAWSDDAREDPRFYGARSVRLASLRSVGCVPLARRGVLYLFDPDTPGAFSAEARDRLAALCDVASAFVDRAARPSPSPSPVAGLVGSTPAMHELFAAIRAFAPMPWPALVLGETGTGKEAVARALHALSPRAKEPFVAVNCGAIPDELAESTLFGHERGAFTGADRRREGLVERTRRGTLFLDEVGDLSPRAQVKLLRLLQERVYERVGGEREMAFEGRIVAATHRPIDGDGRAGFREDLFHRLAGCVLRVPSLRERREDVPALARELLSRSLAELPGSPAMGLDAEAEAWLASREWPGNVRALANAVRAAVARALARGSTSVALVDVAPEAALPALGPVPSPGAGVASPGGGPASPAVKIGDRTLDEATDDFQRAMVRAALAEAHGNKSQAAERLGVSRQWLHRLLDRWGGTP